MIYSKNNNKRFSASNYFSETRSNIEDYNLTSTHPHLTKISILIPGTDRRCSIDANGRSIIITGINGSGKTQLLRALKNSCTLALMNQDPNQSVQSQIDSIQSQIDSAEYFIATNSPASSSYPHYSTILPKLKNQLDQLKAPPIVISNLKLFAEDLAKGKALLEIFEANRQANFREVTSAVSMEKIAETAAYATNIETYFEDYLVSQITQQAYAESPNIGNDLSSAETIKKWFQKLDLDFRSLFEDESLRIEFNARKLCFFICQDHKAPYRLQNLSSGFSSLLAIYASLIMKLELRNLTPSEMYGLVFIDEIDAHLHVSLQRKIFSFLVEAFPHIQFIITTHSPFVVSSVSSAVIYDLSKLEQIDDLSMYSYESILKGLFDTPPVSQIVTDKVEQLFEILAKPEPNLEELQDILKLVSKHESELDSESAMHIKRARTILNKSLKGDADV